MDYLFHIMVLIALYSIFAISLNLELGYTGLYNFGHVAFFGIGAYTSALLSLAGMPVSASMVCAMALAGVVGALLAFPALRLTGDYFGIATLVFAEMVRLFFLNERGLTRGPMGCRVSLVPSGYRRVLQDFPCTSFFASSCRPSSFSLCVVSPPVPSAGP